MGRGLFGSSVEGLVDEWGDWIWRVEVVRTHLNVNAERVLKVAHVGGWIS